MKGKKFSDSQQITDDTEQAQSREYLNIYDYSKSLAEQIDDYKKGIIPRNDTLLVSGTPEIWQKVGFNALPVTINQTHVDYAIGGLRYPSEPRLKPILFPPFCVGET